MEAAMETREEHDSLGAVRVPEGAYYGAQTQRARENFAVSGQSLPAEFTAVLVRIKRAAARVNLELGLLPERLAGAIAAACEEVLAGRLSDQFVVDVYQTGSGTSTNMNVNEVLASRANELLTGRRGGSAPVHPNDHVNLGQSSNDVIPTAIHIAALNGLNVELLPALTRLEAALLQKADDFADIRKLGRTHLQDAVPMTLGDEFGGYARQVALARERLQAAQPRLAELALGGTAVGSGLNAHPQFAPRVIALLAAELRLPLVEARNHFQAQASMDTAVELSGLLKAAAVGLIKIANDLRWLASGPRCGLGEITLPSLQPGSSIMPGKVNPVIAEMVLQVAAQVVGNDAAVAFGGAMGHFELNTMLPLIAHNLLGSLRLLGAAVHGLETRCVRGIRANRAVCEGYIERSLALVTALVPRLGYDRAAAIAKRAHETGRTIRQVARETGADLSDEDLNRLLGPAPPAAAGPDTPEPA
jgi:fumarate hydratase class II